MRAIDADELLNPTDGLEHVKHCEEYGDVVLVCDIVYAPTIDVPERNVGKWIPVTERLPEKNGRYLVTRGLSAGGDMWNRVYIINYSDLMGLKSKRIWWYGNVGKSDFVRVEDVLAWMPLPEPYERSE